MKILNTMDGIVGLCFLLENLVVGVARVLRGIRRGKFGAKYIKEVLSLERKLESFGGGERERVRVI